MCMRYDALMGHTILILCSEYFRRRVVLSQPPLVVLSRSFQDATYDKSFEENYITR